MKISLFADATFNNIQPQERCKEAKFLGVYGNITLSLKIKEKNTHVVAKLQIMQIKE
jgi:hypothetical protein